MTAVVVERSELPSNSPPPNLYPRLKMKARPHVLTPARPGLLSQTAVGL